MTNPPRLDADSEVADLLLVGRALGAPIACVEAGDDVHLAYLGDGGELVADAVVVRDGRVRRLRPVRRSPPSIQACWFGRPLPTLVGHFRGLAPVAGGRALVRHESPQWTVWTHAGRLVRAARKGFTAAS